MLLVYLSKDETPVVNKDIMFFYIFKLTLEAVFLSELTCFEGKYISSSH